jgi:nucleotide-binding universal stress UspA family protein
MTPIRSIVAATDFSADARDAALRAATLAAEHRATLTVLHVVDVAKLDTLRGRYAGGASLEPSLLEGARRMLDELAADLAARTGVSPSTRVQVGNVRDEIRAAAAAADLLAVGEHGASRLRDRLLGTTAARLLHASPGPVLVVKRPARHPYRRLLVPVDFSADSAAALGFALRLAPEADVVVFHAFEVPFEGKLWHAGLDRDEVQRYRVDARRRAMADIGAMIEAAEPLPGRVRRGVRHGAPTRSVLEKADEMVADLIVIGKHGQSPIEDLVLGSVTRHVLSAAECDVAVVVAAGGTSR